MKSLATLFGIVVFFMLPGAAFAQTATYNISGTFTAPATGSFSGSYVVNTGTNSIVSANVQVTAGKASDGSTDLPATVFIYPGTQDPWFFAVAASDPASGNPVVYVNIDGGKSSPSGTTSIEQVTCTLAGCSGFVTSGATGRNGTGTVVAAAPPVPVPTMSEWAMILLGVFLAGVAALYAQRRRQAV